MRDGDLPALYEALAGIGLAAAGAGTILDVTTCPGTDTCKLGISSSRGLAAELRERLAATAYELDEAIRGLKIKVSGCFNSCGQHHVADIGFFGNSRKIGGHAVPHFQVVLGGMWQDNGGAFGLAIGSVPSKRIPEVVDRITTSFVTGREARVLPGVLRTHRQEGTGRDAHHRVEAGSNLRGGRELLLRLGDPREFSMGDYGVGECAGEVYLTHRHGPYCGRIHRLRGERRLGGRGFGARRRAGLHGHAHRGTGHRGASHPEPPTGG